jgi:hypothetical protein
MRTYLNSEEKGEEHLYCRKKLSTLNKEPHIWPWLSTRETGFKVLIGCSKLWSPSALEKKHPAKTNTTQKFRVSNRESVKIYLRKTSPTTVQLELWAHHTVTVSLGTLWVGSKRFSTSFFQEFRIIRECNGSISGSAPIELYLALRILQVTKRATARYETSCVRQQRNLQTVGTLYFRHDEGKKT